MSIIKASAIMAIYLFIVICLYLFLSTPFDRVMDSFEGIDGATETQVDAGAGESRLVFDMMFAILGIVPLLYFVLWAFHREPDWGYRQ